MGAKGDEGGRINQAPRSCALLHGIFRAQSNQIMMLKLFFPLHSILLSLFPVNVALPCCTVVPTPQSWPSGPPEAFVRSMSKSTESVQAEHFLVLV